MNSNIKNKDFSNSNSNSKYNRFCHRLTEILLWFFNWIEIEMKLKIFVVLQMVKLKTKTTTDKNSVKKTLVTHNFYMNDKRKVNFNEHIEVTNFNVAVKQQPKIYDILFANK